MNKKIIIGMFIFILLISFVVAQVIATMNLNLDTETTRILKRVGLGIGEISKTRLIYDNITDSYYNETYIDKLQMLEQNCYDGYCYFTLYEENSINKEFKVKLEKICTEYNETEEGTYCISWREQTSQEIQQSAEAQAKEILSHIASVTLKRESKRGVIIQEVQYYKCLSKSIVKAECPAGLSGGQHTRCYLIEWGKSPWDYWSGGWVEV